MGEEENMRLSLADAVDLVQWADSLDAQGHLPRLVLLSRYLNCHQVRIIAKFCLGQQCR